MRAVKGPLCLNKREVRELLRELREWVTGEPPGDENHLDFFKEIHQTRGVSFICIPSDDTSVVEINGWQARIALVERAMRKWSVPGVRVFDSPIWVQRCAAAPVYFMSYAYPIRLCTEWQPEYLNFLSFCAEEYARRGCELRDKDRRSIFYDSDVSGHSFCWEIADPVSPDPCSLWVEMWRSEEINRSRRVFG